jgi:hypothetical protein
MSIDIMTQVWRQSKAFGSDLLILLAIADHADDHGRAFPSVQALQQKGRMSERNVQYCLKRLAEMSELKIDRGAGPHGTHIFWVLPGGAEPAPVQSLHRRTRSRKNKEIERQTDVILPQLEGATVAPGEESAPRKDCTGATDCGGGVQPVAPESSVLQPSVETKELPPEKANAFSSPTNADECQWTREWPKAKRFPQDFPRNPPPWFLSYCAEHYPHVNVPHEWEYMLDQTFKSLRTQFFMVARRWMENAEEKHQSNGARASPKRYGTRDTSPAAQAREQQALQEIDDKDGAW